MPTQGFGLIGAIQHRKDGKNFIDRIKKDRSVNGPGGTVVKVYHLSRRSIVIISELEQKYPVKPALHSF
jgi:hypothetical protein